MANDNPTSHTYLEKAWKLNKGSFILINKKPCKVVEVKNYTPRATRIIHFEIHARDIFDGSMHEYTAKGNEECKIPYVDNTLYRIQDIRGDGSLRVRTMKGAKRVGPDLILPYDDQTLAQTRVDFYKAEKDLLVKVKSAMGEEHVTSLKEFQERLPEERWD